MAGHDLEQAPVCRKSGVRKIAYFWLVCEHGVQVKVVSHGKNAYSHYRNVAFMPSLLPVPDKWEFLHWLGFSQDDVRDEYYHSHAYPVRRIPPRLSCIRSVFAALLSSRLPYFAGLPRPRRPLSTSCSTITEPGALRWMYSDAARPGSTAFTMPSRCWQRAAERNTVW